MEKVIKFLEQYVQWITLALAGVWVSWQAYSYLVKQPLTVVVGTPPTVATPGTVDSIVLDSSTKRLKLAMGSTEVNAPKPANVRDIVTRALGEADANPREILALGGAGEHAASGSTGPIMTVQKKVNEIPNLPPAMPEKDKISTHWTVVMVPAATQPAPVAAAPANPAAPPVQPVMVRRDTAYTSQIFSLDSAKLTAEFTRCYSLPNVPLNQVLTEFVRVQLLREEQKADGTWGDPVLIPALPIYTIMTHPAEEQPAPVDLKKALYKYKDWFETPGTQDIITRPAFFQTASDAPIWIAPGSLAAAAAQPGQPVVDRPFDPSRDNPRTPEERAQKLQYQQYQQNLQRQQQLQQQQLRRGPGALGPDGRPLGGRGYVPPPGYGVTGGGPTTPGFLRRDRGAPVAPPVNGGIAPPLINPNGGVGLPNQDIEILVHDVSIQEGKTYRYAVRYRMFNPMWDHKELAEDPVADKFDIDSPNPADIKALVAAKLDPEKLWTVPVSVDPLVHVFVTRINAYGNNREADFVVYTWKDGRWRELTVKKVNPGDPISPNKVPTPWTVVDVRKDARSNETYVILMDDHGVLTRRDEASDAQSPELQKLKTEAGAAAEAR